MTWMVIGSLLEEVQVAVLLLWQQDQLLGNINFEVAPFAPSVGLF